MRTANYTIKEFRAIPRNTDGDIIDTWKHFPYITDAQREQLTEDDDARYEDYLEEMRCLHHEAMIEFGLA